VLLHDLAEFLVQSLFETAIDSFFSCFSSDREKRVQGCGCFIVCCLLLLLAISVLVAAN